MTQSVSPRPPIRDDRPVGFADHDSVADELAILRVLSANQQAITDGDVEAYVHTYIPEALVEYWDATTRGHDEIRAYFEAQQGGLRVRDVIVNVVVNVDAVGASARTIGTGIIVPRDKAPIAILAQTTIETVLERDSGNVWRISYQHKQADESFDPNIKALTEQIAALEARVEAVERMSQGPQA